MLRTLLLLASCAAFAQDVKDLPSFEVASVKHCPPHSDEGTFTVTADDHRPGLITYRNMNLKGLLTRAYHLEDYQIDGPSWLDLEEYDITARPPANTPQPQRMLMLRKLLMERLQMKVHFEKKDLPAYVMQVGKTRPTLKVAKERHVSEDGSMEGSDVGGGQLNARNSTMPALANLLSYALHAPVVDMTGIQGEYDVTLDWRPEAGELPDDLVAVALQRQTGLILKKQKAPLDLLVIDHIEKIPTAN